MQVIVIGREQDCNVVLSDVKVSRHHAQLVNDGGRVTICDLNSKNGTFVNGIRINAPMVLNPGDQVSLGGVPIPWEQYLFSPQMSINQIPVNQPPVNQFPMNQVPIQNDFGETNSVKQQKEHKLLPLWISLAAVLLMALVFFGIRMMRNNHNKNSIESQITDSLQEKRNEAILLDILDEEIKEKQATLKSLTEDAEKAQKEAEAAKRDAEIAKKDADAAKRTADLEKTKADKAKADADNAKKAADLEKKKADKAKKDADAAKKEAERVTNEDVDISALYFAIDQLSSEQLKNACGELGCSNKEGLVNKFKSSSEAGRSRIFAVLQKWTE